MSSIKDTGSILQETAFTRLRAYKHLADLAVHPYDLTRENALNPERLTSFSAEACGYKLLYGSERVTEEVMRSLYDLANEAQVLAKMASMQAGEIVNTILGFPSENRAALHTATRDFFGNPNMSKAAIDATALAKKEVDKLKSFTEMIDKEKNFNALVCIGIGGSDLGPRAHFIALEYLLKPGRTVRFISNVDPDDATLALKGLDLKHTLVIVVSKTGTTLETQANEAFVRERFAQKGLDPNKHFLSVTSQGSPMDDKTRYKECFYIWDWIGGRYSTTSMVGGVMLSFAFGFDTFWQLLKGASAMDKVALSPKQHHNLPLLGALLSIWNRNFLHYPTLAIIPYSQALSRFPAHIQQVEMESNGKHIDKNAHFTDFHTGPVIWGEPGTNAQHSFYQLIHQGTDIIPLEFIGYKLSQNNQDNIFEGTSLQQKLLANLFAQIISLATGEKNSNPNKQFAGNRPSHILLAKQLTPTTLGSLLSYFENKVAFEGFLWNINSFDQEGVQLGKVLAKKMLDRISNPSSPVYPIGDALLRHLESL